MIKAINRIENCYTPDYRITQYVKDRIQMNRIAKSKDRSRFTKDESNLDVKLRQDKKRLLENVIFPSMANLVLFFDYLSKYPALRDLFEDDVKELFGFIGPNAKYEDNIIRRLLISILTWDSENNPNNYRTELMSSIQYVLYSKIHTLSLFDRNLGESMANGMINPDFNKVLVWCRFFSSRYNGKLKKDEQSEKEKDQAKSPSRSMNL